MTSVVCPYCFDRSPAARLPYRCRMSATWVRGARPRPAELDTIWADFMGPGVPPALKMRGPVFTAARGLGRRLAPNGGGSRADCPACGGSVPVRVCLRCHSDFPSDYCDQDTRIIALPGPKASGKSTYVSALLNELRGRVGRAYGASVTAMGGETQRRDREPAEDLYDRLRLPEATRPAALGFNDPLQMRAVRDRLPSDDGPPRPVIETPPQQIADDLAAQLRAHGRGTSRGRVTTPVAVAVTKTDSLEPLLEPHSPLLRNADHSAGALDEEDRRTVHEEMRSLLDGWDSGALLRQLERDFAQLALFGLSALGSPLRVEDPLLGLGGLLPRTGGSAGTGSRTGSEGNS